MYPQIMGILNTTPDSFYDGGLYQELDQAVEKAINLISDGADIIDIGGESTRPGASAIDLDTELNRVLPVIRALSDQRVNAIISIDTTKSLVARAAVQAGAKFINDISGCTSDLKMIDVLRDFPDSNIILMHSRGNPLTMQTLTQYENVVSDVCKYLEGKVKTLVSRGINKERIIIDPGFGFAKTAEQNLKILKDFSCFQKLGCRTLAGVSRKSFLGELTGIKLPADRLSPSLAAHFWLMAQGVSILRVHDVKETMAVKKIYTALNVEVEK